MPQDSSTAVTINTRAHVIVCSLVQAPHAVDLPMLSQLPAGQIAWHTACASSSAGSGMLRREGSEPNVLLTFAARLARTHRIAFGTLRFRRRICKRIRLHASSEIPPPI